MVAANTNGSGLGTVILNKYDDRKIKSHISRSLIAAEKNYSQIEKEALVIIFAMKKFHIFIHGREFILKTDHRPSLSINGEKKGALPTHIANKLQCWETLLQNHDYKMEFLPSKKLSYRDGLSRVIPKFCKPVEDKVIVAIRAENEIKNVLYNTVRELPRTMKK